MLEFEVTGMTHLLTQVQILQGNEVGMIHVHGNKVSEVSRKNQGQEVQNCDAIITKDLKVSLKIFVADCLPVALFDPVTNSIGLLHAGWRGLNKKIIGKTVTEMVKRFGAKPISLMAEIGPHICQKHYEIKDDVLKFFDSYPKAINKTEGKIFLDLAEVAIEQLSQAGIGSKNVIVDKRCTFENSDLPSFRRKDLKTRVYYTLKIPNSS